MKDLKLTIMINKPAKDIFDFTLNPENTSKWADSIVTEQTNEMPPRLGRIYRNQNRAGEWQELELTTFEPDREFVLSKKDGYHVRYTLTSLDADTTELEYYEWMDNGELGAILTMEVLEKLKQLVEVYNEENK